MSLQIRHGKPTWVGEHMPGYRRDIMRGEFVVVETLVEGRTQTHMVLLGTATGNLKLVYQLDSFGDAIVGVVTQRSPGMTLLKNPNRGEKEAPRRVAVHRSLKE